MKLSAGATAQSELRGLPVSRHPRPAQKLLSGAARVALLAFSMPMSVGVVLTTATIGVALPNSAQAASHFVSITSNPYDLPVGSGLYSGGDGITLYGNQAGAAWTVTNEGTIVNSYTGGIGIQIYSGTITNSGLISSTGYGISIVNGGVVTNKASGLISGIGGIRITGGVGTIDNAGSIVATGAPGIHQYAISLVGGGTITNQAGGLIQANGGFAIYTGAAATITNSGTIAGLIGLSAGIFISGGTVTNATTTSRITGAYYGVEFAINSGAGTIVNYGTIMSTHRGVLLPSGGKLSNLGTAALVAGTAKYGVEIAGGAGIITNQGTISGAVGIDFYGTFADTVTNSGAIVGTGGTAVRFAGGNDRLIVDPGATFTGIVNGAGGTNTLELAVGTVGSIGTIGGIGTSFTNFGTVTVDSGASWTLSGTNTVGVLTDAGTIGNTGTIVGTVTVTGAGTVVNAGRITASGSYGIEMTAGGSITNTGIASSISGANYGVWADIHTGTVANYGTISGPAAAGIYLKAGGKVTNLGTAARISGLLAGVAINGTGTVMNDGTIDGGIGYGVNLLAAGSVTNTNTGLISGQQGGVKIAGLGTVINSGTITGGGSSGVGVNFLSNAANTLVNSGTIIGNSGTAVRFGAGNDLLVLDPGAVFTGIVTGGGGTNVLELAAGTVSSTGTISGIGTSFTNFGTVTIDSGASWKLTGTNSVGILTDAGTLSNAGVINNAVTLTGAGTLNNSGTIDPATGTAVDDTGTSGTVSNTGMIIGGGGTYGFGVYLRGGGDVTNTGTASSIYGQIDGVRVDTQAGTVVNHGTISGGAEAGIYLRNGGTVTNAGTASLISGPIAGVGINSTGTVVNDGTITGSSGYGVNLLAGGDVTNTSAALISGQQGGIKIDGSGTVGNSGTITGGATGLLFLGTLGNTLTNSGTIIGSGGTAVRFGSGDDALQLLPGSSFTGIVDGGTGNNTIELGAGTPGNTGTIVGLGTSFTNFGQITVDSGASWQITGTQNTIGVGVTLTNNGTLNNAGTLSGYGAFYNAGSLTNSGSVGIAVTLTAAGSVTNRTGGIIAMLGTAITGGTGNNSVSNAGTISSLLLDGIDLGASGTITNTTGATIYGGSFGVSIAGAGRVANSGTIQSTGYSAAAIALRAGGTVINYASGLITGHGEGVYIAAAAGTVTNSGIIQSTGPSRGGIYLQAGGAVTNNANAQITGGNKGIDISGGLGTVVNAGTIAGTAGLGVQLSAGGGVTNKAGGLISGTSGVYVTAGIGTIVNYGTIQGTESFAFGAKVNGDGAVTNKAGGTIAGTEGGVAIGGVGTVTNAGLIENTDTTSGSAYGLSLIGGGTVTNQAGGVIAGTGLGIIFSDTGAITNAGTIEATNTTGSTAAIEMTAGGSVNNQVHGQISANGDGIFITGGAGTVTNAGTITGTNAFGVVFTGANNDTVSNSGSIAGAGTAVQFAGGNDRMILLPGAAFSGLVDGGAGTNTLELSGSTTGTIAGLGVSFTNFGQITVDSGATWQLAGTNTIASGVRLTNDGALNNAGTLINAGVIDGTAPGIYSTGSLINSGVIAGAVVLGGSGNVTNAAGAYIGGPLAGVIAISANNARVSNAGTIRATAAGAYSFGVLLAAGGTVTNSGQSSYIAGYNAGVAIAGAKGRLTNAGTIVTTGTSGFAVGFSGTYNDTVTNSGTINGGGSGNAIVFAGGNDRLIIDPGAVFVGTVDGGAGTNTLELAAGVGTGPLKELGTEFLNFQNIVVDRSGIWKITGTDNTIASGVTLTNNGSVTNFGRLVNNGALISTGSFDDTGTLVNSGAINGTITLSGAGTVTNNADATIVGKISGDGTVTNGGTINGSGAVAIQFGAGNDRLILDAGSSISGKVDGGAGTNTLELAAGGVGALSGLNTITHFGAILVDRGANWQITGTNNTLSAGVTLTNSGTLIDAGALTNNSIISTQGYVFDITGLLRNNGSIAGTITLSAGGTLTNAGTIADAAGAGVTLSGTGTRTVNNSGVISGTTAGIVGTGGTSTITNRGTIRATGASGIAIDLSGASNGTIDNYGIIDSAGSTAIKFGAGTNELVVEAHSQITGKVVADASANNTMVFVGTGTLNNSQFSNFQTVDFYSASWTLGTGETLTNTGVGVKHGTLTNAGTIDGEVSVGVGGKLINSGMVGGTVPTGVALSGGGKATNSGTITADITGVQIGAGSSLTNQKVGLIQGGYYGVKITGAGTLINAGTIEDRPALNHAGVSLGDGAVLTNQKTGTIGGATGVAFTGTGASLSNAGTITGSAGAGIAMNGTGANTLNNSGNIGGTTAGILVTGGNALITNTGTITATGSSGIGISFTGGTGTIDNFGTIDGASGTAVTFAGGTNELILENGGVLKGVADGSDGTNTLVVKGNAALQNADVTGFANVAFDNAVQAVGAGSTVQNVSVIAGTLTNDGTLTGTVATAAGTTLTNSGIVDDTALTNSGLLTNSGTILGGAFDNTGSVDNTGLIHGAVNGITGGGDITNSGTIIGTSGIGVEMNAAGTLTNLAGGLIKGGHYGIKVGAGDVVSNAGTIEDDITAGASIGSGATVINQAHGVISGVTGVIFTETGASLTNSGTITGTGGDAVQFGSGSNTLALDTGSVLNGDIDGGNGAGHIQLGGTGTLDNTIANFGTGSALNIANGADWTARGSWAIASVSNAGILQPGIAGVPLKLTGNFTQSPSGTLRIVFAGVGQASQLQVTGTANLAGSVSIVANGTFLAPGQRYAIVTTTAGIDGKFSGVTVSSGLLAPSLIYSADDAYLTLKQMAVGFPARTSNQKAVAAAIDQAAPASQALNQAIGALDQLSATGVRAALDRLSGEVYTGFSTTALQAGTLFANQIQQQGVLARMGDPSGLQAMAAGGGGNRYQLGAPAGDPAAVAMDHPWGLWLSGYGQTGQFQGDGNTQTLNETYAGSSFGLDYQFADSLRVGAAFGYGQTVLNLDNGNGRGKVDRKQVGLYAGYTAGPAYIDGLVGVAFGDGSATRNISLPGLPAQAKHNVHDTQLLASLEAGYALPLSNQATLTPFAGITIDNDDQDGIQSNGNALDLSVHSRSAGSTRSQFGARFADTIQIGGVTLATSLEAGWAHEFDRTARTAQVALGGDAANSFQVYGAALPGDSATVGLGLAAQTSADSTVYLRYDGDLASAAATHTVSVGFKLTW